MKETAVTGNIILNVDESSLKADLLFTYNKDGKEWDAEKIKLLLSGNEINSGFTDKDIAAALEKFALEKSSATLAVANGLPSELPVPESVKWTELPVPDEFTSVVDNCIKAASEPRIESLIVKKVKVKKKILKKSKIPFVAPKEEIVTTVEKREIKKPIDVNSEVLEKGWVAAGSKIGTVTPSKPGKPGKDIYGKQILPELITEPSFYPGSGIKRNNNEFSAEETGFLRRGANWIDIIPFKKHTWELHLSSDKASCYIDFEPGSKEAGSPDISLIISQIEELECDKSMLFPQEKIEAVIKESVSNGEPLSNYCLTGTEDGFCKIDIIDDNMKGVLTLRKGRGDGKPLVLKEVGAAIKKSGFKGMDFEKIKKDLLLFYKGESFELTAYVLAEGSHPARAEDRSIKYNAAFLPENEYDQIRSRTAEVDGSLAGMPSIEEYPLSLVEKGAIVKKDQVIAAISTVKTGKDGKDIFGKVFEGLPGNDPAINLLENLKMEKDSIIAEVEGILEILKSTEETVLRVRPHQDCVIDVQLSADRMKAFISLEKGLGSGLHLNLQEVNRIIADAGVVKGINSDLLSTVIEKAETGEIISSLVFAEGIPPVSPDSVKLKFNIEIANGKGVVIKENGTADYKNRNNITSVKNGECIAEILQSEKSSQDGWDITGKTIAAQKIPELNLVVGANIKEEKGEGVIKLIAEKSGELIYDQKSISINDCHSVKGNVDLKSGNIKYPGDVKISGMVQSGFYIMSGGDVLIGENVEASLISADGNIAIAQGIKGGSKAILRAKKDIVAGFAEYSTLMSVENIRIKNSCLQCNVKCNGNLILETEKGNLVGGKVRATRGVEAANIGSASNSSTKISFGQDYLVADQIELEEREIEKLKTRIIKYDSLARGNRE